MGKTGITRHHPRTPCLLWSRAQESVPRRRYLHILREAAVENTNQTFDNRLLSFSTRRKCTRQGLVDVVGTHDGSRGEKGERGRFSARNCQRKIFFNFYGSTEGVIQICGKNFVVHPCILCDNIEQNHTHSWHKIPHPLKLRRIEIAEPRLLHPSYGDRHIIPRTCAPSTNIAVARVTGMLYADHLGHEGRGGRLYRGRKVCGCRSLKHDHIIFSQTNPPGLEKKHTLTCLTHDT